MGYLRGFVVTFRKLFEKRVTIPYPEQKRPKPDRLHGRHVLSRYEDGMEKCIGCELCAAVRRWVNCRTRFKCLPRSSTSKRVSTSAEGASLVR